ncbi:MAG: PPC domain-containing DNA-binding protein [Pseudomonadota bacterium]
MIDRVALERGQMGQMVTIRLRPNEDLVEGIELACREAGISHGIVRSAVGSLVDACLTYGDGIQKRVQGPGVEILTLSGEVRPDGKGNLRADLSGTISNPAAEVYGGRFQRGENPICITLELALQEWVPE